MDVGIQKALINLTVKRFEAKKTCLKKFTQKDQNLIKLPALK